MWSESQAAIAHANCLIDNVLQSPWSIIFLSYTLYIGSFFFCFVVLRSIFLLFFALFFHFTDWELLMASRLRLFLDVVMNLLLFKFKINYAILMGYHKFSSHLCMVLPCVWSINSSVVNINILYKYIYIFYENKNFIFHTATGIPCIHKHQRRGLKGGCE